MWISAEVLPPIGKKVLCKTVCGVKTCATILHRGWDDCWYNGNIIVPDDCVCGWTDDDTIISEFFSMMKVENVILDIMDAIDSEVTKEKSKSEIADIYDNILSNAISDYIVAKTENMRG